MTAFPRLTEALARILDPRRAQGQRYPFDPLLLFIVLAMLSGAKGYTAIITYLQERLPVLNALFGLNLERAPVLNTVRELIIRLDPAQLEQALRDHATKLFQETAPPSEMPTIALDGKTLRGSYDKATDQPAAQMLSAYATEAALVLAQMDIDDKSNEIPAAQEMIRSLDLKGVVYTADALHCQKKTFEAAKETGSSLIVQVKDNQPTLLATCKELCDTTKPQDKYETVDKKRRNREEHRLVEMFPLNDAAKEKLKKDWGNHIVTIARVTRKVWRKDMKAKDGLWIPSEEIAYYACQRDHSAKFAGKAIRGHWGIENGLHYTRDTTLEEDASRIRKKPTMFGRLRSFVTNIFQANQVKNFKEELYRNALNPERIMGYAVT